MHQLILGLAHDPTDLSVGRTREERVAIEGEVVDSFGPEGPLVEGTAAGYATVTEQQVTVGDDAITSELAETERHVAVDYLADCGAGYVGVSSSDGEWLWSYLGARAGTTIERAVVDVDGLASRLRDLDHADIWQAGWDRYDGENVGVTYHRDATLEDRVGYTQVGFEADFGGVAGIVRGTVAQSGYVAIYEPALAEHAAAWIREEILPHAALPPLEPDLPPRDWSAGEGVVG